MMRVVLLLFTANVSNRKLSPMESFEMPFEWNDCFKNYICSSTLLVYCCTVSYGNLYCTITILLYVCSR